MSGYTKAFQIHGEGEPLLFYYEDLDVKGINVVMKRDVSKCPLFEGLLPENKYFDFSTPYGYGGWLIEGEETDHLFESYEEWCKKNGVVSEFVMFHPVAENHKKSMKAYETVKLGPVVTIDLTNEEKIWENVTSKNRNMVRKAQKNGVEIYSGRDKKIFEEFRSIYNETMDKDHADSYYYFGESFYDSIREDLPDNSQIFYAVYEGNVIAASIFLMANERINYHLSGFRTKYSSLAPTNLLLYEVARWGSQNGYQTLYLGGGVGSAEDSLFKFKKAFYKGELHRFYIGRKVFDPDVYQELTMMRADSIKNVNFFPVYRG